MNKKPRTPLNDALLLLNRREYSQTELVNKLCEKGHDREKSQDVVRDLASKDIQSDQRALRSLVASGSYRKHGPKRILLNAINKGFSKEDAELAIEHWQEQHQGVDEETNCWDEQATQMIRRQFGQPPYDHPTQTKILRRLLGRGYNYDVAQNLAKQTEDTSP